MIKLNFGLFPGVVKKFRKVRFCSYTTAFVVLFLLACLPVAKRSSLSEDEASIAAEGESSLNFQPLVENGKHLCYAGAVECKRCHEETFLSWKKGVHSSAGELLNAEEDSCFAGASGCRRCHTAGYDEMRSGQGEKGIQCEACHGPKGLHAGLYDESEGSGAGNEDVYAMELQEEICRICEIRKRCIRCHTKNRSPDFRWKTALEHVKENEH